MKMSKPVFYILSFTWGLPYTIISGLVTLAMLVTGHKMHKWGWCGYFEVGKHPWGGTEWGLIFLKDRFSGDMLKNHEFGHAIQNCIFGPFMLILISLPSSLRYWVRRLQERIGRPPKTDYDAIWFEGWATELGTRHIKYINDAKNKKGETSES